jgi:ankyrin repeat protein
MHQVLPNEIITTHILPLTPTEWLFVSHRYYNIALTLLAPTDPYKFSYQLATFIRWKAVRSASVLLSLLDRSPSLPHNDAFLAAVQSKNEDLMQQLVEHPRFGVDLMIHQDNQLPQTPLELAIYERLNSTAKQLLARRADPALNNNGALVAAILANNSELYEILMNDTRVDPSAPLIEDLTMYLDSADDQTSNAPIICAASMGNLSIVKQLLTESRVDSSAGDFKAFWKAAERGHLEIMKYLASLNTISKTATSYALSLAGSNRHFDVVKWLFEWYKDDFINSDLEQLLHTACNDNQPDIAMMTLQHPNLVMNNVALASSSYIWKQRGQHAIVNAIDECFIRSRAKRKRDEEDNAKLSRKKAKK